VDFRPQTSETPREDAPRTRTSRMMSLKVNFPEKPLKERDLEVELTMALLTPPLPSVRRPERATPTLMPIPDLTTPPSRRANDWTEQNYLDICLPMAHEI